MCLELDDQAYRLGHDRASSRVPSQLMVQNSDGLGFGPEPPGLVHGSSAGLFQGGDDMAEIEKICDEKKTSGGLEYLITLQT